MASSIYVAGLIILWLSLYTKGDTYLEGHGDDVVMCDSTPCNTSSSIRCHYIFYSEVCHCCWPGHWHLWCKNYTALERQGDDMVTSFCNPNLHVCNTLTTIRCNIVFFNNICRRCGEGSNQCISSPCQNEGTCVSNSDGYTCTCASGYTGVNCEQDIDECSSNPCQNGATCHNLVNQFKCQCPPRIYGVLCDTNICHPTPADVVFVLDSSISMTEAYFKKQLEFVANFTRSVPVGPRSFQISVVTFSFNAQIEFYLDQYKDNTSIIDAVKNITFKPGSTRTDRGLGAVLSVFSGEAVKRRVNGRQASRFVYLLTDGMSTYRQETKDAARQLKSVVDNIAVIGIGKEVSHEELLDIATRASLVYSAENFNSLYTLLHQLVHNTCDECEHSAETDVAIFIDSSSDELETLRDAATYLIDVMRHLNINETHVGITSFSREIHEIVKMGQIFDKNIIKSGLNSFTKESDSMTIEHVLNYVRNAVFNSSSSKQRPGTKKMLIIFTNGQVKDLDKTALNREILLLEAMGVQIFAVAITTEDPGRTNVNLQGIHDLVQDTFNVFITMKGSFRNLDVLQAEFLYDRCDLKGE